MATLAQFLIPLLCGVCFSETFAAIDLQPAKTSPNRDGWLTPIHTFVDDKRKETSLLKLSWHIEKHQKERTVSLPNIDQTDSFGKISASNGKMEGMASMKSATVHQVLKVIGRPDGYSRHLGIFDELTFDYPHLEVITHNVTKLKGSAKVILERPFLEISSVFAGAPRCEYWLYDVTIFQSPRVNTLVTGLNKDEKLIKEVKRRLEQHVVNNDFLYNAVLQAYDVFMVDFCPECDYISKRFEERIPLMERVKKFDI